MTPAGKKPKCPDDVVKAAVSFYAYDDAGDLTRVFTSYIPGEVSAIDMTPGLEDGVVIVGHVRLPVANPDHEEWAPFQTAVTKLTRNPGAEPGNHEEMTVEWQTFFYNPREFPEVDGDRYIRDEVWGVLTVHEADGHAHDGYVFVAGDGDETDDVDEESPYYGVPSSSTWMSYVGFVYPDGTKDWDEVYYTDQDSEDLGNEAGEYIATTDDGGFVIFVDTDNQTDAPNAFGFTEIGPR